MMDDTDKFALGVILFIVLTVGISTLAKKVPHPRTRAADVHFLFLEVERLDERVQWLERNMIREENEPDEM